MIIAKIARQSLLMVLLCAASITVSAQQQNTGQQASPLDGTGLTPNVVSYKEVEEYSDPLMRFNRAVFKFNDVTYRYILIPAAQQYQKFPAPVRTSIGNFFDNIKMPISFVNHLLQLKPRPAGVDLSRFVVNSTVGLAGFFDPATSWLDIEKQDTNLSATLIQYGAGHGTFIVLPIIGPSNARDGSAFFVDGLLNPLAYILDQPETYVVRGFDNFQDFAPSAESYLAMRAESQDLYIFMRNLHLQGLQRNAEFK